MTVFTVFYVFICGVEAYVTIGYHIESLQVEFWYSAYIA